MLVFSCWFPQVNGLAEFGGDDSVYVCPEGDLRWRWCIFTSPLKITSPSSAVTYHLPTTCMYLHIQLPVHLPTTCMYLHIQLPVHLLSWVGVALLCVVLVVLVGM